MKYILPLAIVTVLCFSACVNPAENASGYSLSTINIEFDRETFEKERQSWGEWRDTYLPNYFFTVTENRGSPGGSGITVKNGKWYSVDYRAFFQDRFAKSYQTMDDVFAMIERMVSGYTEAVRDGEAESAYIRASYDIINHYPRSVSFGYNRNLQPLGGLRGLSINLMYLPFDDTPPVPGDNPPSPDYSAFLPLPAAFDRETFEEERRLWKEWDIPNYSFRVEEQRPFEPSAAAVVTVKDGRLESAGGIYEFMDDVFKVIETRAAEYEDAVRNGDLENLDIRICYSEVFHYPYDVRFNYTFTDSQENGYLFLKIGVSNLSK
jgi:hypothetical protein